MTRLTDERLRKLKELCHDAGEPGMNSSAVLVEIVALESLVDEVVLLRAECRAAREMREYMKKFTFTQDPRNRVVLYDAARKAVDDAGFQP